MFKKALIAGAVLASMVGSNAFASDLIIKGRIVPNSCVVTLGGGTDYTIDYQDMSQAAVQAFGENAGSTAYIHPEVKVALDISCAAPLAMAMSLADSDAASKFALGDGKDNFGYGLGKFGAANVGQFRVDFSDLTAKKTVGGVTTTAGGVINRLASLADTDPTAWTAGAGDTATYFDPQHAVAFIATAGTTAPDKFTNVTGNLAVVSYFNKSIVDSVSTPVPINGKATMTLSYH